MAIVHEATKEVVCKIVYHGAGRSGKTTNLLYLNHSLPSFARGQFVTLETPTERTLFFDMLPVLAEAEGWKFRFLLYATPGQSYYHASRRLVFKGADAIVFVVDSQRDRLPENSDAWELLEKNLKELGQDAAAVQTVIQYNKRDLPGVISVEDAQRRFNPRRLLQLPAVARTGQGVQESFVAAARMALARLQDANAEKAAGPAFRSVALTEDDATKLSGFLTRLMEESGALGATLVDESTGVLATAGKTPTVDRETLGALLATNFTAANEVAHLLGGAGFAGITQAGEKWILREARIDARRFVVLVCGRLTERRKLKDAVTFLKGPLAAALAQIESVSPDRLARMHELFTAVPKIALTGLEDA